MPTFQEMLISDLSVSHNTDEFGETVTYNGSPITAIVDYGPANDANPSGGRRDEATITVKASDVPAPANNDMVVIGGTTWRVQRPYEGDGHVFTLLLISNVRPHRQ